MKKSKMYVLIVAICPIIASAQNNQWQAPQSAISVTNPIPSTPVSVKEGKDLYMTNCSPCHGSSGKGDGPASASLTPPPADHTSASVQNEKDGAIFWKLSQGHSTMPSYAGSLTENQRWALVNYIRTLAVKPKKKKIGDRLLNSFSKPLLSVYLTLVTVFPVLIPSSLIN